MLKKPNPVSAKTRREKERELLAAQMDAEEFSALGVDRYEVAYLPDGTPYTRRVRPLRQK